MFTNKGNRGFTLIELLVVIAIIGILSSVVLASLNTARNKGANASVKSNLNNIRAQAELYYDNQNPNRYASATFALGNCPAAYNAAATNLFAGDQQIVNAINSAATAGGAGTAGTRCWTDGTDYLIAVQLKVVEGAGNTHWCVDSQGQSKARAVPPAGSTSC